MDAERARREGIIDGAQLVSWLWSKPLRACRRHQHVKNIGIDGYIGYTRRATYRPASVLTLTVLGSLRTEARTPNRPTVAAPPRPISCRLKDTDLATVAASSEYASSTYIYNDMQQRHKTSKQKRTSSRGEGRTRRKRWRTPCYTQRRILKTDSTMRWADARGARDVELIHRRRKTWLTAGGRCYGERSGRPPGCNIIVCCRLALPGMC